MEGLGEDTARDGLGVAEHWCLSFPSWCDESLAQVHRSLTIRSCSPRSPLSASPVCYGTSQEGGPAVLGLHGPHCSTGRGRGGVWRVPPAVTLSEQSRGWGWSPVPEVLSEGTAVTWPQGALDGPAK